MLRLRVLVVLALLSPLYAWGQEPNAADIKKLIAGLDNEDASVRGDNIQRLGNLGPEGRAAIPALIERLQDKGRFSPSIDHLSSSFEHGEIMIRGAAFDALGKIGLEAVPALVEVLAGNDVDARYEALEVISKIGPGARTSVSRVASLVSAPEKRIRRAALSALVHIDQDGSVAVPLLQKLIQGDDESLRQYAADSLRQYPKHPQMLSILTRALKSADPAVRGEAARILGNLPGPSERIVELLLPLIHDEGERQVAISNHLVMPRRVREDALEGLLRHQAPSGSCSRRS